MVDSGSRWCCIRRQCVESYIGVANQSLFCCRPSWPSDKGGVGSEVTAVAGPRTPANVAMASASQYTGVHNGILATSLFRNRSSAHSSRSNYKNSENISLAMWLDSTYVTTLKKTPPIRLGLVLL